MFIFGSILGLITATSYSYRFSIVKDLGSHNITKSSLHFYTRLISLPPVIIFYVLSAETIGYTDPFVVITYSIVILINIIYIYYQTHILQTQKFILVESLFFLNTVFNLLGGILIYNEIPTTKQFIGISIIIISYIILYLHLKAQITFKNLALIIVYYLILSTTDLLNKYAIKLTSPNVFALICTLALICSTLIASLRNSKKFYKFDNTQTNIKLITLGLLSTVGVLGISYSYKFIPIGILSALISTKTFISLFISHKKYDEGEKYFYIICSLIAFIGVLCIFI